MRGIIIENKRIVNIIEVSEEYARSNSIPLLPEGVRVSIGDEYEVKTSCPPSLDGLDQKVKALEQQLDLTEDALNFLIMNGGTLDG